MLVDIDIRSAATGGTTMSEHIDDPATLDAEDDTESTPKRTTASDWWSFIMECVGFGL